MSIVSRGTNLAITYDCEIRMEIMVSGEKSTDADQLQKKQNRISTIVFIDVIMCVELLELYVFELFNLHKQKSRKENEMSDDADILQQIRKETKGAGADQQQAMRIKQLEAVNEKLNALRVQGLY